MSALLRKFQEIRSADRSTRVKWVFILSAVSSVLVILIWIASLNVIAERLAHPELRPPIESTGSVISKLGNAFRELKLRTANTFEYFTSGISKATSNEVQLAQPEPPVNSTQ